MNKFKKCISFVLVLVMVLNLGITAFATETEPQFTLEVDKTSVEEESNIVVTIKSSNIPNVTAGAVKFYADPLYFSVVSIESEMNKTDKLADEGWIKFYGYSMEENAFVTPETVAVITLKATDPVAATEIRVDDADYAYYDDSVLEVGVPADPISIEIISHIHDYTHETEVVAPTCTEGGYTKHSCACGDSYTDNATSATGHTYVDGTCSVCGAAGTIIPEGAPFTDMITTDGQPVTVTLVGTEPVYGMGPLYKVEVPLGTKQVNVTYPEGVVGVSNFGYSMNMMIGFEGVSDDGYGVTKKDGKVTVGLAMEKAAANGSPVTIKLINVPYGDEPRSVGFYDNTYNPTHFLAFTYKLGNGQHFAALPEGIGYTVTGSPIASDGYTFQVSLEDGYEATADFAVKVNGNTVATQPGQVSVPSVTKDLDITVEGVAKIVDPDTDIFVTIDLTDYTGPVEGSLYYMTRTGESSEVTLTAGKKNSLALNASDNNGDGFWASIYSISPLVIGYDINGTVYPIPNEYSSYNPGSGFSMNMDKDGYLQLINRSTTPSIFVVKPIVGTSESLGAAPDFAEPGTIDVTDITVVGADVISSAWEGDTLNVILAEDTALNASLKTMWTIYANNTKEGASQPCFNINGRLQTPGGTEATFTWDESLTLEDGTATKTYAFEVAEMSWNPESALEFTNKTFTINFYVSGKEPAPTYTVSIDEEITGGTVTADPTSAEEGAEITLTVTPDDGYILKTLTVTDDSGEEVTVADNKFTMPASNVTVSAVFEEEVSEPEYKSEYGITVMVGDEEMDLVANGTETCGVLQAQKLNVTVPAGTTEVKFVNITDTVVYGQMYVYNGAHNWEEFASNVTEATISLTECGTSFCVSDSANAWYHVNITVEEPAPSYKSSYGITVMVGDEEMDLVANGTETCGVMQAQKLNVTVPAGTTEVKFLNITDTVMYGQMYVYSGAHDWTEYASNVTEATISLAECGTSFCISDSANAWYHVTIVVEEPEQPESNRITEIELAHPNFVKDEQTGELSMNMVTGATVQIDLSFAVENEELEATQVILWTSSDPETASVKNGKVTALKAGTVTITAKAVDASGIALAAEEDEVLAQFTLTVADPDAGYTVEMGADVEAVVNNTVSVPVTVGNTGDVTKYNAFDFTFTYDPNVLELTSTEISGMTVTAESGTIHVERYGTDLTVGNPALTLTFQALTTGSTNVKVTSAKVDISEAALTQDAPDASVIDNVTKVSVTGYTVSLPTEFKGESSVLPGENYTFEAKDKNYNYAFEGSTMNGQPVSIKDNGDGTFTVENVTGDIVILTQPTGKTFTVTLGEDMTSTATNAQYMTAYTATLNKADGYNYNVTVTINNVKFTGFTYDAATGLVTIPGEAITGEIVFNSNKTAKTPDKHSVEFAGEYGDIAEGTLMEVENGTDYVLTINKVLGYKYTVTATMGGETVEVKDNGDGTYTIKNVTGDLVITIAKEYDLTVEVAEYVKLNGKVMFLVTATGSVDEGKILAYDGTAMFWSNQYNAWSYLMITEGTLSVEDVKAKITLNEGEKVELDQTYNVNESVSGTVDINDAQLVFDMYNNKYQDFDNAATMQKFLKADVNGDKTINTSDAAAVVSEIVKNK